MDRDIRSIGDQKVEARDDTAYVFDRASGLYKPRDCESGDKGSSGPEQPDRKVPLPVRVARDKVTFWVSILTLLLLGAYTYETHRTVETMKKGMGRAWIRVETESIALKKPPQFGFLGDPKDHGYDPDGELYPDPYPGILMETGDFPIELRNFGTIPAQQSVVTSSIFAQTDVSKNFGSPIDPRWVEFGCDKAKYNLIHSPDHNPVFPGEEETNSSAEVVLPTNTHQIYDYSIVVCVAYQEIADGLREFHHTAVLYCGDAFNHSPTTHAVDAPKFGSDLWYSPDTKFRACQTDAN